MREQIHDIGRRRAWAIWLVAVSVYVLAVFHRSSLGVAGLIAADRFHIEATQLAFFTVLQLVMYAGMQIPVGVLLDRWGPRIMLSSGLILMTVGQLAFAFADTFLAGVASRALVGAGDAMVFISVIRLVASWFLVRQVASVSQLTGYTGQLGAVLAAAPLTLVLHSLGWTRTFALASSIGVVLLVVVLVVVEDSPYRNEGPVRIKLRALAASLRTIWGNPGTRLGMWSHFTSQSSVTVFTLLWGYPFLVTGQGLSPALAGTLLMAITGFVLITGALLGWVTTQWPFYRSWIVIGIVVAMAIVWTVVLARSEPSPIWLLTLLCLVMAAGGPASLVGFDLARTFTPEEASGRANGVVNIGGFVASLLMLAVIGVILDLREPGGVGAYDLADFRVALSIQYVVWIVGIVQILRYRAKGIAHLRRLHPGAVEQMKAGEPFVHPGFNDREGV